MCFVSIRAIRVYLILILILFFLIFFDLMNKTLFEKLRIKWKHRKTQKVEQLAIIII